MVIKKNKLSKTNGTGEAAISEHQLRAILDATPFPIALVDVKDEKIEYWSRSASILFGHTASLVSEWYKLAYPEQGYRKEVIKRWKAALKKAQSSRKAFDTGEYRVTCSDGSVRVCKLYATFLNDRLVVTFNDITEIKKAEEVILYEQNFSEAAMNSLPGVFYLFDEKKQFIKWNKNFEVVTGYSAKELKKISPLDLFDEPDKSTIAKAIKKTFKQGSVTVEGSFKAKNGNKIPYYFTGHRMIQDEKPYLVGMGLDISERKRNEELIKKENERFQAIFESSRDAIMTLEPPNWMFTSGNPSTIEMFACKNEKDFISRGPWQYSPPNQPDGKPSGPKAKAMIMKAMQEGSNLFDWTHRKKNGQDFPATVLLTRVIQKNKTFLQATVRDITERKEIEKKVEDKVQQMEFVGRVNLKRYKEMMELKKENQELKKRLEKLES